MGDKRRNISGIRGDFDSGIRGDLREIILGRQGINFRGSREQGQKTLGSREQDPPPYQGLIHIYIYKYIYIYIYNNYIYIIILMYILQL